MPLLEPSFLVLLQEDPVVRKRTSSFSYSTTAFTPNPRGAKTSCTSTSRGSDLRRTESVLDPPEPSTSAHPLPSVDEIPRSGTILTLNRYKERRLQRQATLALKPGVRMTICTTQLDLTRLCIPPQSPPRSSSGFPTSSLARAPPQKKLKRKFNHNRLLFTVEPPSQKSAPSMASPPASKYYHRNTSPLTPNPGPRPPRPVFPRSKRKPNIFHLALKHSMMQTPNGRRALAMGARLAYSVDAATQDLAAIVAEQLCDTDEDDDVEEGNDDLVMLDIKDTSSPTATAAAISMRVPLPMPVRRSSSVPMPTKRCPSRSSPRARVAGNG